MADIKHNFPIYCSNWVIDQVWISWKSVQERSHWSAGRKLNYSYACALKPYPIFNVKNASVKSVYYVAENTICNRGVPFVTAKTLRI